MRLSEAMMLGSTTCEMVSGDMNSCAIGAACNAVGMARHSRGPLDHFTTYPGSRYNKLPAYWPWLSESFTSRDSMLRAQFPTPSYWNSAPYDVLIFELFDRKVCAGKMTLERLVDMVRHDEPQCECNRFDCACARNEDWAAALGPTHGADLADGGHADWKTTKAEGWVDCTVVAR